jgi:hypothetical protein
MASVVMGQQQQQAVSSAGHGEKLYHAPRCALLAVTAHAAMSRFRRSIPLLCLRCAAHCSTHSVRRLQISIADFDFIQRLGDGSFSTVVLGRYKGDGRCYAVKIVNKSLVLRNKVRLKYNSRQPDVAAAVVYQLHDHVLAAAATAAPTSAAAAQQW